jgi:hypothetical protein
LRSGEDTFPPHIEGFLDVLGVSSDDVYLEHCVACHRWSDDAVQIYIHDSLQDVKQRFPVDPDNPLLRLDVLLAIARGKTLECKSPEELWSTPGAQRALLSLLDHGVTQAWYIPWDLVPDEKLQQYANTTVYYISAKRMQIIPRLFRLGYGMPFGHPVFSKMIWTLIQTHGNKRDRLLVIRHFIWFNAKDFDNEDLREHIDSCRVQIPFDAWELTHHCDPGTPLEDPKQLVRYLTTITSC